MNPLPFRSEHEIRGSRAVAQGAVTAATEGGHRADQGAHSDLGWVTGLLDDDALSGSRIAA